MHRDLKPANVMVTTDGRVKILDFGLAKQTRRPVVAGDETVMVDHTEPGMIVGTVSYMSPEQARGKPADYRSDQFSFGLVLYEMAMGKKAFDRDESVQTMAAIIGEEPPPIDSRLPAPLRWAIDRCLAKEPSGRYESSRDLFRDLRSLRDHLSEVSSQVGPIAAPAAAAPRSRRILGASTGVRGRNRDRCRRDGAEIRSGGARPVRLSVFTVFLRTRRSVLGGLVAGRKGDRVLGATGRDE